MINLNILFLQGHEADKLNLFAGIANNLNNDNITMLAFSSYEKSFYKKYTKHKIDFIPRLLSKISKDNLNEYKKYTEDELFDMSLFSNKFNELNNWKVNADYINNLVVIFLEYLHEKNKQSKIDTIVMWNNTMLFDRIAWHFCMKNNINYVMFEQGYFRPFTLTIDNKGVNYENSLPRDRKFYEDIVVDYDRLHQYLSKSEYLSKDDLININRDSKFKKLLFIIMDKLKAKFSSDFIDCTYNNESINEKIVRIVKKKNNINTHQEELPESYIFVPFQVHDDSQIILNSPNIRSMEELVEVVDKASKELYELGRRDIYFVFKEHPVDLNRIDYSGLKEKYKNNKQLVFLSSGNTNELINNSMAVITVNSTVGIEALMKSKKVITLGNAFYNIEGIVEHCDELENLSKSIIKTLDNDFNQELVDKFLYYLRFDYQLEMNWRNPRNEDIKKIVAFIKNSKED